ncbi:MAG: protein kinase [Kofleriaceae bacterium]|nr:protein kinase [Kofleriaceae bacterium]
MAASSSVPSPYEMLRVLGHGGFGEVFLVRDPQRGDVAMKRLTRLEPSSIARFKNEFRLLQGLRHPALATLFELTKTDHGWHLLMEYVPGEHFTTWVRPGGDGYTAATMPDAGAANVNSTMFGMAFDEARLRDAMRRLASGLLALHESGIIHRDLKPSNVLVAADGRVVILDFGLAASPASDAHHSLERKVLGTPGYIAPEQATGRPITRAVDWYAVGVMLFEALTGRRPYIGSVLDIVEAQLTRTPPDPATFGRTVPEDLRSLCMRLLAAEPEARPDGPEVLALLGGEPARPSLARALPPFVGRVTELATIREAVDELGRRGPSVLHLVAPSGFGKSALLVRGLADARERTGAIVLGGRCYEREAVPYKAIDPLIDALTEQLRRMSAEEVLAVVPRDAFALCRMFPALAQIDELARAPDPERVENPEELRRRAISALRELLARLADRKPLVLSIDDLQWGCLDSARLLADLLAPPAAPRLLLVLAYRPEEQAPSPPLAILRARLDERAIAQRTVVLGPLSTEDAEAMARAMLPADATDELVQRVARESGQSPLFVAELALAAGTLPSADGLALDGVIAARVAQLSPTARGMLELIAIAARAVELAIVCKAAAITARDAEREMVVLEEANLVRHGGAAERVVAETLHDRIREVVVGQLGRDMLATHHRTLAEALVDAGAAVPQTIAEHFRLAGELARARRYALAGAEAALEALAPNRAIELYRVALAGSAAHERFEVLVRLGEALAFDSRGLEASDVYREAIAIAPTQADAVELKGRVAHQLLSSGRLDEGLDGVEEVLAAARLRIPTTPRRALMSMLYQRARLRLRGRAFVERSAQTVPRDVLTQIDACWAVSMVLSGVDLVRSADLQSRHLRLALDAGDPYRIARGLALEAILLAIDGTARHRRADEVLQHAEELAQQIGHPHAMAWAHGAGAVSAWTVGRFRDVVTLASYAIALLRSRCMDVSWEIGTLEAWFRLRSLLALGDIATAVVDTQVLDRDAERRSDLYALTTLRTAVTPLCRLFAGDPDGAVTSVRDAIAGWSNRGWFFQHQEAVRNEALADMYRGHPGRALEALAAKRPPMKASMMLRIQNQRILLHGMEGVASLAAAEHDPARRAMLTKLVRTRAQQLAAENNPWGTAVGKGLEARLAAFAKADAAPALLEASERTFDEMEMALHAAMVRRVRGVLVGGDAGKALVEAADRELSTRGVAEPAMLARWLA